MPASLHRSRAQARREASSRLALPTALCAMLAAAPLDAAWAQNATQGNTLAPDPAQAAPGTVAKPDQSAHGNAAVGPAAQNAPPPLPPGHEPDAHPPANPPPAPKAAVAEAGPAKGEAADAPASDAASSSYGPVLTRPTPSDPAQVALIERGAYLVQAADCMPCHSAIGGRPYAGGLILNTPFGRMATPNITPDQQTGIGAWTKEQFWDVLHRGIGEHGKYVYPTMTYTSYTKMPRADVDAVHAYLMSLQPVYAPRLDVSLDFPFNIRESLLVWRTLFFRPDYFKASASKSAEWNRGAYLVEGPGHCGECHSPRNVMGGIVGSRSLAGARIDSFWAPNISSDPHGGIGAWSEDELVEFLQTGSTHRGVVFGPMSDVVHESMAHLTGDDVHAIAFYLKNTPARPGRPAPALVKAELGPSVARGHVVYVANCAQCHQESGLGVKGSIPNLAGNDAIRTDDPGNAVTPVLAGLQGQGNYGAMPRFGGALGDQELADLANYIRTAWGNGAVPNATPTFVRALRATAPVGLGGSIAARLFGCPKIGEGTIPGALATEGDVTMLATADRGNLQNGITGVIARVRRDNPDAAASEVVTALNAAYCPVVATRGDLTREQKSATLIAFTNQAGRQFARLVPPNVSRVLVSAPLPPDAVAQINQAAAAAGMTPGAFIAKQLSGGKAPASMQ
nr:c-type cytochrome [uncultured Lichenicoccus sp.]